MRALDGSSPAEPLGAHYQGDGQTSFLVWAPHQERVGVSIAGNKDRLVPLERDLGGYHRGSASDVRPGDRYFYVMQDGKRRPDPASRAQPEGVHGYSAVVDPALFRRAGGFPGLELQDYVLYELHVGTFTPERTLDAIIPRLGALRELGVSAVELMPLAAFPGPRNWGYDGVGLYAVHESYGGVAGLCRLIDACHDHGLAVVIDVVYNHLGPEGNYLADFGPYFTDRYATPWGQALNFDGPQSDEVRRFFIENALFWTEELGADALRLDAIHAIRDHSAYPFLTELAAQVQARAARAGRRVQLFAESDLNDARVVKPWREGGFGHDAMWSDDFHHALHGLLTGERNGYYEDFGELDDLARALEGGFRYQGERSPHRQRRHGNSTEGLAPSRFVVCAQNHDQVGNRMLGERLTTLVSFEAQKLAAAALLLSPFLPLLFMGEEYGEVAPFLYFVSHGDPELVEAVRRGRKAEFEAFAWQGEAPDPQAEATFRQCTLRPELARQPENAALRELYTELLRERLTLRKLTAPALDALKARVLRDARTIVAERSDASGRVTAMLLLGFGSTPASISIETANPFEKRVDTAAIRWRGPGEAAPERLDGKASLTLPPSSCVLYTTKE